MFDIQFLTQYIEYAPFIIGGLLFLAGFNVPISEDLMIILTGLLAINFPDKIIPLYIGLYLGAYSGDFVCYFLGLKFNSISAESDALKEEKAIKGFKTPLKVRIKLFIINNLHKVFSPKRLIMLENYYAKYAFITLFFGRFIPFGVRNAIFFVAGLSKMRFIVFAIADAIAAFLSTSITFTLVYNFGPIVKEWVMRWNIVVFIIALFILSFFIYKYIKNRNKS